MSTNIKPVSDLRRKTRELLDDVRTENAVYITQHGRPVAVLVNYERYEQLLAQIRALAERLSQRTGVAEPATDYAAQSADLQQKVRKEEEANTCQQTKQKIEVLLDTLTLDNLVAVQRFVEFLNEQVQQGQPIVADTNEEKPPYLYPTVPLPASALEGLIDLMPPVGGDALADTEALYDEV